MTVRAVHHLNCGTMILGLVSHCLLIETSDSLVLVDSGFGTDSVRDPATFLGPARLAIAPKLNMRETALHQIEALGYDRRDVRHIVLTHLDLDHAGGIADFPWATVHVHGPELRAAQAPGLANRLRYRTQQWRHGPQWQVNELDDGETWFGLEVAGNLAGLPPEIVVIPLYGHTHGHIGVAVDTDTGWLLHAGDALLHTGQLCRGLHPTTLVYGSPNPRLVLARVQNVRRLRELRQDNDDNITIFAAHDRYAFARLSAAPPTSRRYSRSRPV
ncbi:hypothetical protein GOEFS_114_00050 [Gordonia effusa NBRC 100432]|uniref:Metallo-beta-lactamase domain-containing protein n=1 Tax=Gordonia effusa NBRC 100432 TaxID=1077974 RepID=H0R5K2_9ACTN|nr:MBL fold metallo-hydrolase [Gordonia effusa]GAB20353.1 hypothetical protein GOEFS_114_00050 [Gordonia effusa NBRC 100432]